jgi:penicillin-binding protein 1A
MSFNAYIVKIILITLRLGAWLLALALAAVVAAGVYLETYILPELPEVNSLRQIQFQTPLRVYTQDGRVIAEFGEQRRYPIPRKEIPETMIKAVLAIEDARFYEHPGVDFISLVRAAWSFAKTGELTQGGSTITMQVARNFFLSPEKTAKRKISEMLLAFRIEAELDKDEILALYFNKIYFGHRAYGIAAAAQAYYGKAVKDLSLAEMAMLAGLPKAPSANNPIANPERALIRRDYVLLRMRELGYINDEDYQKAVKEEVKVNQYKFKAEMDSPYLAEMARDYMVKKFGDEAAYTSGFKVYTTSSARMQIAAQWALRDALIEYDNRHGYRGVSGRIDLPADWDTAQVMAFLKFLDEKLQPYPIVGNLYPAVVLKAQEKSVLAYGRQITLTEVPWKGMAWARPYIDDWRRGAAPKQPADIVRPGDVIYLVQVEEAPPPKPKKDKKPANAEAIVAAEPAQPLQYWRLAQIPKVAGALVALQPDTGAILAVAGGFDYNQSKFNRVTQAERQPGSVFKPFIYSAGLEHGFTPATLINDAPLVVDTGLQIWKPENYSMKFYGPTRLRKALALSRNLVSIRLMQSVGVDKTVNYITRFGFERKRLPRNLTLALGTPSLTPLEVARGFATFANGGYLIEPYFIERIEDANGKVIEYTKAKVVCRDCNLPLMPPGAPLDPNMPPEALDYAPRVIAPQNAWLMTSMLKDVIQAGTATRAKVLGRTDLAGKTGTTNEQRDAWFTGYNAHVVASAWVGFDQPRSLGAEETGGRAALPMWIDFMREALHEVADPAEHPIPPGLVSVRINKGNGLLAYAGDPEAMFETFMEGNTPKSYASQDTTLEEGGGSGQAAGSIREQLF